MIERAACTAQVKAWQGRMEEALAERLPDTDTEPTRLHAAMRYSVLNGGRRVRPLLQLGIPDRFSERGSRVSCLAAARLDTRGLSETVERWWQAQSSGRARATAG